MNGIDRLLALQVENDAAGVRMLAASPRFLALAQRHITGTAPRAVAAFNLFQTPRPIAARMADIIRAHVQPGARILEPSVGLGRLYEPFADVDGLRDQWVAVENASECARAVASGFRRLRVVERDFLATTAADLGGAFDAVVMNPPFQRGTDIRHIRHALGMVRVGGVLVSLCYNGARQNAELRPLADQWEVLPADSFRECGTGASVAMLVIEKKGGG